MGCNTTSCFKGKGKKLAWQAYADATETLEHLANHPFQCLERTLNDSLWSCMTEQALSLQSTRSGGNSSVGEVDLWRIPPIKNTFPQHVWRAVYQADNLYSSTALGARSQHPQIHGTQRMFAQGKLFELQLLQAELPCSCLCNCKCNKSGADPGGGWIGCLVTPLWVKLSTQTIKIGNHVKLRTVRHVQCARCLSSGHGNPDGKLIVSFCTLCGRGHIPFPCSPPQLCQQCGTGLYSVTPAPKFLDQPLNKW